MCNVRLVYRIAISALISSKLTDAQDVQDVLTNGNVYTAIDEWQSNREKTNDLALDETHDANSTEHSNTTSNTTGHVNTTSNTTGDVNTTSNTTGHSNTIESSRYFNTTASLRAAIALWMQNETEAQEKYGHMGDWDVSSITDMKHLFCCNYQNASNVNVSKWNTSAVENMYGTFQSAKSFNGDVSEWDTSAVKNMQHMFHGAKSFKGDLSKWKTSAVERMDYMFYHADSFNGDISVWNMSSVVSMNHMFQRASSFNIDISKWDVSNVKNMSHMFSDSIINQVFCWNITNVTNVDEMFCNSKAKFKPGCVSKDILNASCSLTNKTNNSTTSSGFALSGLSNLVFSSFLGVSVTALMVFV